jgi:acyl-CoA synthetase (AMP-forming)/AMP-acid ligase II
MPRIDSVLSRSAIAYPMAIAVQEWPSGNFMTYKELDSAVTNFASWCQSQQIQNNEVIAIHLPNTKNFLICQFGTFRAGATAAYINFRLSPLEVRRQLLLCKAKFLITTVDKALEFLEDDALKHLTFIIDESYTSLLNLTSIINHQSFKLLEIENCEEQDAIIRFTSGSTGNPKGVIVSHRSWLIRAISIQAEELNIPANSNTLILGPLTHQAGLFVLPTMLRGATLHMMEKLDFEVIFSILSKINVTCIQMVPTILGFFLHDEKSKDILSKSHLERVVYGGSPIRQSVLEEVLELLPETEFIQSYGSHECGSISFLDGMSHRNSKYQSSAGRPFLASEIRLKKIDGESYGEIEVKAPWLPHAKITELGREVITSSWSNTGDLAEIVDGYIFLRDRLHDVIITGGFNVYPMEVEKVIGSHPSIFDGVVVSAPDDKWGEKVIAFIVPRSNVTLIIEDLKMYCRNLLADYKVPKEFIVISEIPLNVNGKHDRRKLSESFWQGSKRHIN